MPDGLLIAVRHLVAAINGELGQHGGDDADLLLHCDSSNADRLSEGLFGDLLPISLDFPCATLALGRHELLGGGQAVEIKLWRQTDQSDFAVYEMTSESQHVGPFTGTLDEASKAAALHVRTLLNISCLPR